MAKLWLWFKNKFFTRQFITFGVIGLINTAISQAVYIVAAMANIEVGISSIMGDFISMIFSYFANMHFTYHRQPNLKSAVTFPLSYLPGIAFSAVSVIVLTKYFGVQREYAKALAIPIVVPMNYLCMNVIVRRFANKKQESKKEIKEQDSGF